MKKLFVNLIAVLIIAGILWPSGESRGAGLSTGHTWTNGELITHTKLNLMVNGGTVTNISTGDIADLANTLAKQAADSVNSSKIVNLSIVGGVGGDINYGTIETTNILAGTFNGREFGTTVTFTNATTALIFNTNQILAPYVQGTNFLTGTSTAGFVPKLNVSGKIDPTLCYASTNKETIISGDVAATAAVATLASVTTTATNGTVLVFGLAQFNYTTTGAGDIQASIDDGSVTMDAGAFKVASADFFAVRIPLMFKDTLTGTAKTYTMKARASGGVGTWELNGLTDTSAQGITNACKLEIIEIPRQ